MMHPISRRQFLRVLALAAGASVVAPACWTASPRTRTLAFAGSIRAEKHGLGHQLRDRLLQWPQLSPQDTRYDVVIAGGGLSGLALAHWLRKMGVDSVLVLEKEDQPGGLCRGQDDGPHPYAVGAHYMEYPEPGMHAVNELFADCGVVTAMRPDGWPVVDPAFLVSENKHQLYTENGWEPYDYPVGLASDDDLDELERFEAHVHELALWRGSDNKPAFGLPLDSLSADPYLTQLDNESMADYLRRQGFHSELLHWYCNIWIVDEFGVGIDRCSAWAGLQFFRHRPSPEGLQTGTVSFAKGLGYLTERIVEQLPPNTLRTRQWVVRMEHHTDHVLSTVYDEATQSFYQLRSRFGVFALPKPQVYHLVPQLAHQGRNEFRGLRYAPWLVATIHLSALPDFGDAQLMWDNTIFRSWTMGYVSNHQLIGQSPQPDAPQVITLYACFDQQPEQSRAQMLQFGWQHWASVVLEELEKAHPEIEQLITQLDIWLWGHPMRQPVVGSVWGAQRKAMQEPLGPIYFSHVDLCGLPVAEEAIHQAQRLAGLLAKGLRSAAG